MNYYSFHIGDYASHTRHLSLIEDLAYRRLLDAYYLVERPLNASITSVARQLNMRKYEKEIKQVLEEFFQLTNIGWVNQRADREIRHYRSKIEQTSNAGKASAQRKLNARSTDVQLTKNQEPRTKNQEESKSRSTTLLSKLNGNPFLEQAKTILQFLNEKAGRAYRGNVNLEIIIARLKDGATVEDCRAVIAKKCREWTGDEKMVIYLRPATLFNRTKFSQYQGELVGGDDGMS